MNDDIGEVLSSFGASMSEMQVFGFDLAYEQHDTVVRYKRVQVKPAQPRKLPNGWTIIEGGK